MESRPRDFTPKRSVWMAPLCLLGLCACGHGPDTASVVSQADQGDSAITASARTNASDPALTPLSSGDVQLYLSVMREAVLLVQHPSAADIATRKRAHDLEATAQKQRASMGDADKNARAAMQAAMVAAQRGDVEAARAAQQSALKVLNGAGAYIRTPSPEEDAADMRVMQLDNGSADAYVAEQRHIDSDHWDAIVDAVETAIPDPRGAFGSGDPLDHPYVPSEYDRKVEAVTEINRKTLAPDRSEILTLMAEVRHPHHTP